MVAARRFGARGARAVARRRGHRRARVAAAAAPLDRHGHDRRRSRRSRLAGRARDRARHRDLARREREPTRRDARVSRRGRHAPVARVRRARPGARIDPRLSARSRLGFQRRLRRHRARHVQRSAARLRVLREPARRADGSHPGRREPKRGATRGTRSGIRRADLTEQGFVVEMAIPFSQLRFPRTDGEREWGIDVLRFRPRDARARISNNALDRGRNCYVCQFEQVHGLGGARPARPRDRAVAHGRANGLAARIRRSILLGAGRFGQRCRLERALGASRQTSPRTWR